MCFLVFVFYKSVSSINRPYKNILFKIFVRERWERFFIVLLYSFAKVFFFRKTFVQHVPVWKVRIWTFKNANEKEHNFSTKKKRTKADEKRILCQERSRGGTGGQFPPKILLCPPNNFSWTSFLIKFHAKYVCAVLKYVSLPLKKLLCPLKFSLGPKKLRFGYMTVLCKPTFTKSTNAASNKNNNWSPIYTLASNRQHSVRSLVYIIKFYADKSLR